MIKENKQRLMITLSKATIKYLKETAKENNITISQLLDVLIFTFRNEEETNNKVIEMVNFAKKIGF